MNTASGQQPVDDQSVDSGRLLVIAYHYPPDNTSTGVLRTWKFTQYLCDLGWQSRVVSVPVERYRNTDYASLDSLPSEITVARTAAVDLKEVLSVRGVYPDFLCIPDRFWPWYFSAMRYIRNSIAAGEVDAIYATYPVSTALLIAASAKRLLGKPLVVDFRDPWVESSLGPLRMAIESRMERRVIALADRVICNTPAMRRGFLARYPQFSESKFVTITNGYDEPDFADIKPHHEAGFEIIHPGLIDTENRDPGPLLEAVARALGKGWLKRTDLRIRFLGTGPYGRSPVFRSSLKALGLENIVSVVERRIPYREALCHAAGADVLVVLGEPIGSDPKSTAVKEWSAIQVPAKVYEYLRIGRPLLALVSGGAIREVIDEVGAGEAVSPRDIDAIAAALRRLYEERILAPANLPAPDEVVARYDRRSLSIQLARTLDEVARIRG